MTEETQFMPKSVILAFGIYLIILNLMLMFLLVKLWPGTLPLGTNPTSLRIINIQFNIWPETRYLLIVAIAGALGSYIHLATSFADYLGNRQLIWSWGWWYVLRPFIGATLAVVLYFIIRGGLLAGTSSTDTLSIYGVAAIAGMAGMFSKQAADKLREIFENLFRTENKTVRRDSLQSATAPSHSEEGVATAKAGKPT